MTKVDCPDCEARCEDWGARGWRCPWATTADARTTRSGDLVVTACGRPYSRSRVANPPFPGTPAR